MEQETKKKIMCFFGGHDFKEVSSSQNSRPALVYDRSNYVPGVHIYQCNFFKCEFCNEIQLREEYITYGVTSNDPKDSKNTSPSNDPLKDRRDNEE